MYQAIIVDDEQMIINSLALGFDWKAHGYEIAATCTKSTDALSMIQFIRPDVVFTDIKMPCLSGIDLMKRVQETLPHIQFVLISGYADFQYAQNAIRLGASGYCLKPLEDEDIESALANVSKHLEERQAVIQSSFESLMLNPNRHTAQDLLSLLFDRQEIPDKMTVLLSIGEANFLLSGNVCYFSAKVSANCYLYFISFNAEFLTTVMFKASLLRAVTEQRITSVSWQETEDPVNFLMNDLLNLFDAVYYYFVSPAASLGISPTDTARISNGEFLKSLSIPANKGRIKDVLEILVHFSDLCPVIKPSEAVILYNTCSSLISRAENTDWFPTVRYPYELARRFENLGVMLNELIRRLESLTGSVNPENVNNETFREILDHINHNFTSPISFQDISNQYTINASYLSQLFKKELGITFTSYLTNLRLQYAKELLETTTLRINEIPEKIGYGYDYNFAKLFKKETGMTPREYREASRKKLQQGDFYAQIINE